MAKQKNDKKDKTLINKIMIIFILINGAVWGFYVGNRYSFQKSVCNYKYSFFDRYNICEDTPVDQQSFESHLEDRSHPCFKNAKIVDKHQNTDGSFTMTLVKTCTAKSPLDHYMEYRRVFRNVVSVEQERAMRIEKENKEVQKEVEKQQEILCTEISSKSKSIKSVKYDKKTNTCFVVSTEPVINPGKRECIEARGHIADIAGYSGLTFTSENSKKATGIKHKMFELKNVNDSFKDFIINTSGRIHVKLDVTFPNSKTFTEDFAEKCAADENCSCTEEENGEKVCEKHITYPVFIPRKDEPVILDHIGGLETDENCIIYTDKDCEWTQTCAHADKEFGIYSIKHPGVKVVFDDVKKVSNKTYGEYEDCVHNCLDHEANEDESKKHECIAGCSAPKQTEELEKKKAELQFLINQQHVFGM